MISSIFGKTKPINYIIILAFLFVFYWIAIFLLFSTAYNPDHLVGQVFFLAILLFNIFIVNFIVKRNKITANHSFTILFFTLLIVLFPEILLDNNGIFCSFFLLLAIRRLLSIKSLKLIKLKLFDATFWIVISSFFYDWALLYVLLVFITIFLYESKNIRNWFVPIIAILTVFITTLGVLTIFNRLDFLENHYTFSIGITADYILKWESSLKLLSYILITLVFIIITFIKVSKSGLSRINTMRLVTVFFLIGLAVTFIKSSNEITPILLTFFPASVFISNYIESIKRHNIKEMVLIISLLIPFIVLFFRFC